MEWVYKVAGILSAVCGAALLLAGLLLRSLVDPDGRRMYDGGDVRSLAGFGILLICAGAYLALSKAKSDT